MSAPEKIFEYFASVRIGSGSNRECFMTPADFVRSITPYNYSSGADVGLNGSKYNNNPQLSKSLETVLKMVDQDNDGLISFSEYIFFTSLLSIPPKYFEVAFNIYDEDGNGSISAEEFKSALRLIRQSNPIAQAQRSDSEEIDSAGIYSNFFGDDKKAQLTFEKFNQFLCDLREAVLRLQFGMIADPNDMKISARDYAMNLVSYGNIREMSDYLSRVEKLKTNPNRISYEQFRAFSKVLESLDEIDFALKSFVSMGEPFSKNELKRAAKAVADVELSTDLLDIVFYLFDKNDGRLDYHEFVGVLGGRQTFGFSKPRDSGFLRFTKCLSDCWQDKLYNREFQYDD